MIAPVEYESTFKINFQLTCTAWGFYSNADRWKNRNCDWGSCQIQPQDTIMFKVCHRKCVICVSKWAIQEEISWQKRCFESHLKAALTEPKETKPAIDLVPERQRALCKKQDCAWKERDGGWIAVGMSFVQQRGRFQIRGWQLDALTIGSHGKAGTDTRALSKGYCLFKWPLQYTPNDPAHTHTCIRSSPATGEISSRAVQWDESLMSPIHSQNNKWQRAKTRCSQQGCHGNWRATFGRMSLLPVI